MQRGRAHGRIRGERRTETARWARRFRRAACASSGRAICRARPATRSRGGCPRSSRCSSCDRAAACGRTGVRAARVSMRDAERPDVAAAVTEAGAEARRRCGLRIDDGAPAAHPLASAGQ
ncbi:hypothetical protein AQ910_20380 [Burkholderia pseudomallei]|nr:hypothetical protein AQ861_20450 [Burkholderia pseudomallei]ONB98897.1 hypothetical protein AQ910_20380 [Burkholderia pseudomallei]